MFCQFWLTLGSESMVVEVMVLACSAVSVFSWTASRRHFDFLLGGRPKAGHRR